MKIYTAGQHVGIADAIWCLEKLGHEVVNWSYSGHSHIRGWVQRPGDFKTGQFGDRKYCRAWMKETRDRWEGCGLAISYYPPVMGLAFCEEMPTVMMVPVRLGLDVPGPEFQGMLANIREHVDEGRMVLAADSQFDRACTEFHVQRPCRYVRPVCRYFESNPPEDKGWYVDSAMRIPDIDAMPDKEPEHWHARGFVHVPYQVSTISYHERIAAGFQVLVPGPKALAGLWRKKWAPCQAHFGAHGFDWETHLHLADWYTMPNCVTWDTFGELGKIMAAPPPVKPYDKEEGMEQWRSLISELSS